MSVYEGQKIRVGSGEDTTTKKVVTKEVTQIPKTEKVVTKYKIPDMGVDNLVEPNKRNMAATIDKRDDDIHAQTYK